VPAGELLVSGAEYLAYKWFFLGVRQATNGQALRVFPVICRIWRSAGFTAPLTFDINRH